MKDITDVEAGFDFHFLPNGFVIQALDKCTLIITALL